VNLALVGFKVFPVVILGGARLHSGRDRRRLIVGVVENIAAGYVDPTSAAAPKTSPPTSS